MKLIYGFMALLLLVIFSPTIASSTESVCAEVKIQITQELTLERQAFEAHMRINNGLTHLSLENVNIEVLFTDEDGDTVLASSEPDDTEALFYIRIDSEENIDDTTGSGTIAPSTSADIYWLIIPARGAAQEVDTGTLYYVGAELSYTLGGESYTTQVSPDYIYVKPMPALTLDYFLPTDVYGDDPMTSEIEVSEAFSLGVRVSNNGEGTAFDLKIDSAQPVIVDNSQGLLVNFVIEGCEVNGEAFSPSLLAYFGDIDPRSCGSARWTMTASLSGKFESFAAEYSHSDELGGELTSLIEAVNTHELVHDVLADLPGKDDIRDFLAKDESSYRIYESDNTDTGVTDASSSSGLTFVSNNGTESIYRLATADTAGLIYIRLADPFDGQKPMNQVARSDGKVLKEDNFWMFKTRDNGGPWQYYICLFDGDSTGSYTVTFDDESALAQPPVLQFIPDRSGAEEKQMSFIVEAADPNGTIPVLSASSLPPGAQLTDQGDGTAVFDWIPADGQAGAYRIRVTASDGGLEDTQAVNLTICPLLDKDCDDMDDQWELDHFGTLDRDGTGDLDGDGITDIDEFLYGFDPNVPQNAPTIPEIRRPYSGETVLTLTPDLSVFASFDPDNDILTYEFEIYSDSGYREQVALDHTISESGQTAAWTVPVTLENNHRYYWRARAFDGIAYSQWNHGKFFVNTPNDLSENFGRLNTLNDPPLVPVVKNPGHLAWMGQLKPTLSVHPCPELELEVVRSEFEIYSDPDLTGLIASGESDNLTLTIPDELENARWIYWRVRFVDTQGIPGGWSAIHKFFVKMDEVNAPPIIKLIAPDQDIAINNESSNKSVSLSWEDGDSDSNAVVSLFYDLDSSGADGVLIMDNIQEDPDGPDDTYQWDISGLDSGTYYIYARISDGSSEHTEYAPGSITWTANLPPYKPSDPLPANGSVDSDRNIIFSWTGGDPDSEDTLIYDVYLGVSQDQLELVGSIVDDNIFNPGLLQYDTTYYWAVVARDQDEAQTSGPVWQFTILEPSGDADGDGLDNEAELKGGTDPFDSDSDDDGFSDFDEIQSGTDPNDPDSKPNSSPVADAGSDVNTLVDAKLTLDGSGSHDPDEDLILFDWHFKQVPVGSILSDDELENSTSAHPCFVPDATGEYIVVLQVSDGFLTGNDELTVTAAIPNVTPNARAGEDINALIGQEVNLSAQESWDPDQSPMPLSYMWSFESTPDASSFLSGSLISEEAEVFFTPDSAGDFILKLIVDDGELNSEDTITVTSFSENVPPNCIAGEDFNVDLGELACLDGSLSFDPDNFPSVMQYKWHFVNLPAASILSDDDIVDATMNKAEFTPDVEGTYVMGLQVTDGKYDDHDNVAVTAVDVPFKAYDHDLDGDVDGADLAWWACHPGDISMNEIAACFGKYDRPVCPIAKAGPDHMLELDGSSVLLDGSASYDPDNAPEPLLFSWWFETVPDGSMLNMSGLTNATATKASFIPDVKDIYEIRLSVNDGQSQDFDMVKIIVHDTPIESCDFDKDSDVDGKDLSSWIKNPGNVPTAGMARHFGGRY